MLDFSRQYAPLRQEVLSALTAVCDSQRFILGPQVAAFEAAAAAACAARHAIGCASGTDALWLALAASGIGTNPGAPDLDSEIWVGARTSSRVPAVVTTPFSFFATASSILRAGARPLFADIDPRTFNLSPDSVAEVLAGPVGASIKAILPVHLYGQCADWDAFAALQRDHPGLLLIEDAAQAFGATWTSASQTGSAQLSSGQPAARPAGSLGDAAAFSFYPTKNLAAMGDAGLVTTSSAEIDRRARSLRTHGMTRRYFHDEVGCNSRMDDLQAAVLNVKLRHIDEWNQQRRTRAARYDQLFREANLAVEWDRESSTPLRDVSGRERGASAPRIDPPNPRGFSPGPSTNATTQDGIVLPYTDPRATPVFHQYVIRAPRRDDLRAHLAAQQIGSEIYYPVPIHLQAALRDLGHKPGDFPHAELAAAEVLALPLYPELRDDEQQTVVAAIRAFYA
jgi:dTDP-4-amino-4,6-dideoxygalactose transaminase